MATLSYSDYISLLNSGRYHPVCKLELLHSIDETTYDAIIKYPIIGSSSNLTISNNSGCRRSISLSFDNNDGQFTFNDPNSSQMYIDTKFNFYLGIENQNGDNIFFPQGVFCLARSQPEINSNFSEHTVTIRANDKWSLLDTNITGIYQIPRGESLTQKIKEILKICNDPQEPIFDDIVSMDTAAYTLRWDGSSTYATIIKEIANMHSRDVYYDINGQLRYEKFIDAMSEASQWDFSPNTFQYMGSNRILMNDKVYNQVNVVASNSNGSTYTGFAQNTDLTSPNNIYNIPIHTLYISDNTISSDSMAQQRAETELSKVVNIQETISLKSLVLPHLSCNQAITLTDNALNLNHARYFTQTISMPLDMKSAMTINGFKFINDKDYMDFSDIPASSSS